MDPFIEQLINSFDPEQLDTQQKQADFRVGDVDFYYSQDDKAKRVYSQNKYVLYHYTSVETAKKIIEGNSLRFSHPNDFNDPFDLNSGFFDYDCNVDEFMDFINLISPPPCFDKRLLADLREKVTTEFEKDPNYFIKSGIQQLEEQKNRLGIACFSDIQDNALMWGHYADKHKGICLGLNLGSSERFTVMPMNYKEKAIRLNFYKHFDPQAYILYVWLYTKPYDWNYEREVRAICPDVSKYANAARLIEFPKVDLKEIYFGVKSNNEAVEEIEHLLSQCNYEVESIKRERVTINPKTYSLNR